MNNVIKIFVRLFLFVIFLSINSCFKETREPYIISPSSLNEKVIITDTNKIYPSLNYQNCLIWDQFIVKEEAKESTWKMRNYTPHIGHEGIIIHVTHNCNANELIAIIKVGENYLAIANSGIKQTY